MDINGPVDHGDWARLIWITRSWISEDALNSNMLYYSNYRFGWFLPPTPQVFLDLVTLDMVSLETWVTTGALAMGMVMAAAISNDGDIDVDVVGWGYGKSPACCGKYWSTNRTLPLFDWGLLYLDHHDVSSHLPAQLTPWHQFLYYFW